MAGRGRGRGRGLLQQSNSSPGNLQNKKREEDEEVGLEMVAILIDEASLEGDEETLSNIYQTTEKFVQDKGDLKVVAELIYSKCIKDREFAKCGACMCDKLQDLEVQGTKFRNVILGVVQKDFKDKDNLRQKYFKKYLGFFTFLCQIFANMRLKNHVYLEPLVGPIYDCVDLMVQDSQIKDDELECLSSQLMIIAKDLNTSNATRMTKVMEHVRLKIIQDGLTPRGRCILLELLECYFREWNKMPNDLTLFYCDAMAEVLAGMVV